MKRILLILYLFPVFAKGSDIALAANTRGLPDDFRKYFFNSEVITQVYLNDFKLFDAAVSIKEDGEITLLRSFNESQDLDPHAIAYWKGVLQNGIPVGKCVKTCAKNLMEVEYRMDNSVIKLYTSQYETSRTQSKYIPEIKNTPNGVIMYNDVSLSNTASARSWGINSSLTSSFADWNQKVSFQSSGIDGRYNYNSSSLYELYTQKELQGNFFRMGFFSPDSDTGNVQTSGFGYDTVVGAMWGSSDAMLINTDSISAWPVYVTGTDQSIAEVWRDGRLIHTQQLIAGVQALDTRQLPNGIYDVSIKVIENGRLVDTQSGSIYKPQGWSNPDKRWRMNLWSGQRRTIQTGDADIRDDKPFAVGGGIDIMAHPRAIIGMSGSATENEHQIRARGNFTVSSDDLIFAQHTIGENEYRKIQDTDIRYYRNIYGGSSASLYWKSTNSDVYGVRSSSPQRGNTWGTSLSMRLPWTTYLILNSQYIDTLSRKGVGADFTLNTLANVSGRDVTFKISAYDRPGFNNNRRDHGISLGLSLSLAPAARHTVSAETGMSQNQGFTSLNYQWQPGDDSALRTAGGGISYNPDNVLISGNASADTRYVSGDIFSQYNSRGAKNTFGGNLSQVLVFGGGKTTSVNGNMSRSMESALIVDLESDDESANVLASGNKSETKILPGRNIVQTELWKTDNIQFMAQNGEGYKLSPERYSLQMNRGSVGYIKVKATKTLTIIGMLHDENGVILKNRFVDSDVSGGVINAEGVLTIDSGINNKFLIVRHEQDKTSLRCFIPQSQEHEKKVNFLSSIKCLPLESKEDK